MNTKSRYEELKQQIHFHNYRYHVLDAPVISDLEFDKSLKELRQIEADHPDWVTDDSPTLRAEPSLLTVSRRLSTRRPFSRLPTPSARTMRAVGSSVSKEWMTGWKEPGSSSSPRSTVCRLCCTTTMGFSCRVRLAATGKLARISLRICGQ